MKFDYVIGNPPYQLSYGDSESGNKTYAPPIYHAFMDAAFEISDRTDLITPARFLFDAGSTPKAWNHKMLNDPHLKVLDYKADASTVFPNTDIKGGVAITYHDDNHDFGIIDTFTAFKPLNTILHKVRPFLEKGNLTDEIFLQNKFDLDELYSDFPDFKKIIGSEGKDKRFRNNIFDKVSIFTDSPTSKEDIKVLGLQNKKRCWKYIPSKYVDQNHENLNTWKVLVVRVNGTGSLGETLSTPVIAGPGEAYTQTFIGLGSFREKEQAENALKYIKTKFLRVLLGVLKITQDNNREVWRMIPLQDFTDKSDIDWSKSISEIDQQLYKKYGLDDDETEFIESHVKEMN